MYVDQRITQITVAFQLGQGLWREGAGVGGPMAGASMYFFMDIWEEGERTLLGKEGPLWMTGLCEGHVKGVLGC